MNKELELSLNELLKEIASDSSTKRSIRAKAQVVRTYLKTQTGDYNGKKDGEEK